MDGENVVDYLTRFATLNAAGTVEPHADWNQLMYNPALGIQGLLSTFSGLAPLFPGNNLTFGFENGTKVETAWLALYNDPGETGPLTTGGDFYNFFVLGIYPASYDPLTDLDDSDDSTDTSDPAADEALESWYSVSKAYPKQADIYQDDLSISGGGILTGYFSDDLAILSIPSFDQTWSGDRSFSQTVNDFISSAKAKGLSKVLIDLQRNSGGDTVLAFDTFRKVTTTTFPPLSLAS